MQNQHPILQVISADNAETTFPSHTSLHVDGEAVDLVSVGCPPDALILRYDTDPIPVNGRLKVKHVYTQVYRVADVDCETELRAVDKVTLNIHNQVGDRVRVRDAWITHPMRELKSTQHYTDVKPTYEHLGWVFEGGLLPGHTIIVMWEAKQQHPMPAMENKPERS